MFSVYRDIKVCTIIFAAVLAMGAVDVAAQHIFLDECERTHAWQPKSCYMN
tara:strand:- start:470 stop:622 length:153 start_codon:yes stop_codon:yes gene_type:complete